MEDKKVTSTELIWPDKKTEVERVILPFQTVETVNKPRMEQWRLSPGKWPENYPEDWKNKLIWGDNKYVMASLLEEFVGKIDLIYIDPPFATGADFSMPIEIGDIETTKEPSVIEELAYRDTWGKGISSYLQMMYERLVLMKELLSEKGSIYVHLDWHVGHFVKIIMDEIFGRENFQNEIVWSYRTGGASKTKWSQKHDVLLFYSKSENFLFNTQKEKAYTKSKSRKPGVVDYGAGEAEFFEDERGVYTWVIARDVWDIPYINSQARERLGFPTQKPEALLERIIKASSNEGSLVADFFCGSGTTGAVAEKLGRRWIMSDLSKFAIQTTRKRLLNLHNYSKDYDLPARPFEILNMGNYQKQKFIENGNYPPMEKYVNFILELYRATPVEGFSFIHGKKGRHFVHVSGVDSIVTEREVRDAIEESVSVGGKAIDILGWDFEMGLDELVERISDEYEARLKLVQIPKESMELESATPIRFFDMNYLEIDHKVEDKKLTIELTDFIIANQEYLPDEVRDKIRNFSDYIDYWAVDFNYQEYQEDTFHNMWQSFRTRNRKQLDTKCSHRYDEEGTYSVLIKVVDVFGNDTNKLLKVEIR